MFKRFSFWLKAKFSRVLDNAENVGETLDYSYQQQLTQLQNVKRGIADLVTAKKRVQLQSDKLQQQEEKLDRQARDALTQGREDIARLALERKVSVSTERTALVAQVEDLQLQQDKLVESQKKLQSKIEQFRTKKEVIKAQYSAAEAQVRISEAATGVGESMADVGMAMGRAIEKTEQMKARADAVAELEAAGTFEMPGLSSGEDDIDRELAQLGAGSQVSSEMERMKAELGIASPPAELEAGEQGVTELKLSSEPATQSNPPTA